MTAQSLPNTGIAVIIDIGDAADIHPKDKQDVRRTTGVGGSRHRLPPEDRLYGSVYKSMKREGDKIRLSFSGASGGLVAKGGDKLTGFAVAGEIRCFHWADATISATL